jgi:hypothetical protein
MENICHYEEDIYCEKDKSDISDKSDKSDISDKSEISVKKYVENNYVQSIIDKININNQTKLYEEFMYSF